MTNDPWTCTHGGMSDLAARGYVSGMIDDPYEVLQVHEKAELDVIRAAFRTLARKYHPDFGGTGARMVSLNEAWSILGDPKTRSAYDKARAAAANGTGVPMMHSSHASTGGSAPQTASRASKGTGPAVPSGPGERTLDFGRYAGWSLRELARQDPTYLEWLARTPIGRPYSADIDELLAPQVASTPPTRGGRTATATKPASRFSRRR
jgi:curved DNA-binding protein CbpA